MAELILKTGTENLGDETKFQDGDIIHAYNQKKILWIYADEICHVKNVPVNPDGLRPLDCLTKHYLDKTRQFRFERISKKELLRVNQFTSETAIISDVPNEKGEYCNVEEYLNHALEHPRHRIFGTPDNEIFYDGNWDFSQIKLDAIWAEIEAKTVHKKSDYSNLKVDWGKDTLKQFLAIPVTDFDDSIRADYESPQMDTIDPENPVMLKRRQYKVEWSALLPTGITVSDVLDKTKTTDIRDLVQPFITGTIAIKK